MFEDIYVLGLLTAFCLVFLISAAQHFTRHTINALGAGATILLAAATTYLAWMGNRQLLVLEADQRPWLFIASPVEITDLVSAPPSRPDLPLPYRAWIIGLTFPIKNTGRAPAIRTSVSAKFVAKLVLGADGAELLNAQQRFCDEVRKSDHPQVLEHYVFPNESLSYVNLLYSAKMNFIELETFSDEYSNLCSLVVSAIMCMAQAISIKHGSSTIYDVEIRCRCS